MKTEEEIEKKKSEKENKKSNDENKKRKIKFKLENQINLINDNIEQIENKSKTKTMKDFDTDEIPGNGDCANNAILYPINETYINQQILCRRIRTKTNSRITKNMDCFICERYNSLTIIKQSQKEKPTKIAFIHFKDYASNYDYANHYNSSLKKY